MIYDIAVKSKLCEMGKEVFSQKVERESSNELTDHNFELTEKFNKR